MNVNFQGYNLSKRASSENGFNKIISYMKLMSFFHLKFRSRLGTLKW